MLGHKRGADRNLVTHSDEKRRIYLLSSFRGFQFD